MNVSMEYELVRDMSRRAAKKHIEGRSAPPPQSHPYQLTYKGAYDVAIATLIDFKVRETYISMLYVVSPTS